LPPAPPFSFGFECTDGFSYQRLPTKWFGQREQSLLITALINGAVFVSSVLLFLILHRFAPAIRNRIYNPLLLTQANALPARSRPSSAAYPPRVWFSGLRWLLWPPTWSPNSQYTLELCMMIRFLSMNFRLFSLFAPFAFFIMLPVNGLAAWEENLDVTGIRPPAPPPGAPSPFAPDLLISFAPELVTEPGLNGVKTAWGGLESLSLTHLPPGSDRFYASVICM